MILGRTWPGSTPWIFEPIHVGGVDLKRGCEHLETSLGRQRQVFPDLAKAQATTSVIATA